MPNIKDLLSKIESGDISYEEKLAALSQVEASLQELKAKKEERVKFNVQLIIDEIKKIKQDVQEQLDYARSIIPERGPKGDQGERGADGAPGRDGVDGRDGVNGRDGQDGEDGVSVTDAKIDFDGSLIISLSTGREINVGEVVSADLAEKIKVTMSTNSTVAIQDEGSTISSGVRSVNFTGAGVTATASGDSVTVDIPGGGGSPFTTPVEINVNSTSSALKINQIGTGNALLVEDSTSPDSTPTVIDQFGNVLLGKDSRQSAVSNKFEVHSTASETNGLAPSIGLYNWAASASSSSHLSFFHYPSGTVGTTTTANASGDVLGRIRFFTQNGSGVTYNAAISGTTASDLASVNLSYSANSHSFTGTVTSAQVNFTVNTVTVTTNAGTIPITHRLHNFTNSSAAAMTITLTTTGAVDGQMAIVRIYDASAATQSISWVNTENSAVSVPTTSNGSTTLPLTVGFMYNNATSRWRCIASA